MNAEIETTELHATAPALTCAETATAARTALRLLLSQPDRAWRLLGDTLAHCADNDPLRLPLLRAVNYLDMQAPTEAQLALADGLRAANGGSL